MMARNSNVPSRAGYRSARPMTSRSSLSACNARPVHTEGPLSDSCTQDASLLDHLVGTDKAGRGRLARAARSTQRLDPTGNGPPDFVRRIFLDEMDSLDRHLGLGRQAAGVFENLAAGEDSAGLGLQEQLGHIARLQPARVRVHDRGYVG